MSISFDINPLETSKQYVTYTHSAHGQTFYVGACKLSEIMSSPGARLNPEWVKIVRGNPIVTLTIHATFDNINQANAYAKTLTDHFKAHCNLTGTVYERKSGPIKCVETEETFTNASAACKVYGIAPSAMSHHLNNHTGYKTLRGMTFRRMDQ